MRVLPIPRRCGLLPGRVPITSGSLTVSTLSRVLEDIYDNLGNINTYIGEVDAGEGLRELRSSSAISSLSWPYLGKIKSECITSSRR